jgi:hypothetical protein
MKRSGMNASQLTVRNVNRYRDVWLPQPDGRQLPVECLETVLVGELAPFE